MDGTGQARGDGQPPAETLPGRRGGDPDELADPAERRPYSPFDLEPDERSTRPASESWHEALIRGRASRTWFALHNVVFVLVLAVAATVATVVLLVWLFG